MISVYPLICLDKVYHTGDVSKGGRCYWLIFQHFCGVFLFVLFFFFLDMNFDNKISSYRGKKKGRKKEIEKHNLCTIIFGRCKIYVHETEGEKVGKKTNTE